MLTNPDKYLEKIHLCMYAHTCAIGSICVCKQAHTFMYPHVSVYMLHTHIQISVRNHAGMCSVICQMQDDASHMPNLEWWPALAASLINLMDS